MHTSRLHWEVLYMIEEIRLPKSIFDAEGCPSLVKEEPHYRWSETPILICWWHWDTPTFIHHDSNTANTVPTCVCLSGCSTHTLILGILGEKCLLSEGCHQFSLIGRKCTTPNAANNCGHENQLALTWKRWMSKQGALSVASCSLERLWMRWHSFFSGLPLPELSGHDSDVYRSNRGTRRTETKQTKRYKTNFTKLSEQRRETQRRQLNFKGQAISGHLFLSFQKYFFNSNNKLFPNDTCLYFFIIKTHRWTFHFICISYTHKCIGWKCSLS